MITVHAKFHSHFKELASADEDSFLIEIPTVSEFAKCICDKYGARMRAMLIDPKTDEENDRKNKYAKVYWEQRQRRGVTFYSAQRLMRERNYFAAMMVNEGDADALISGYSRNYPTVVKPMLELIGMADGVSKVATTNIMMTKRGPIFLSDTSINIDPDAKTLAKITQMTSSVIKLFGLNPVMAMVSYSNFGSSIN